MPFYCNKCGTENNDNFRFCGVCGNELKQDIVIKGPLPEGTVLQNRYTIIKRIKKGGMGAVYKASDNKLESICAIKELLPSSGTREERENATKWFKRESRILAQLDHPNLPRVIDYFICHNRYYLVMSFIEGEDLDTILQREGSPGLPVNQVIKWSIEILSVLDYLHSSNPPIIYRDIKPGNIMIHKDKRIMLIDFGIARAIHQDSNTQQTIIGTLIYTPLEQLQGKAEARSDIYALGVTMHHLISGVEPMPLSCEPLIDIVPSVSPELNNIVMKAVQENPADRHSGAKEMLEALSLLQHKGQTQKTDKDSPLFWNNKGVTLCRQKNFKESIECFDRAIELNPSYTDALVNKGISLSKLKKYDDAIKCYSKALEFAPKNIDAWNNRGITLSKEGKHEEAIRCYDKGLEINPTDFDLWNNKGSALFRQARYKEAIHCYRKALQVDPHHIKAWNNMGNALYFMGKFEEAIKCYDETLKSQPAHVKAMNNKGFALYALGKYEEAIECYDRVLELNPSYIDAWYNRGCALYYLHKYDEAIKCYDRVLELNPAYIDAWYNKGATLYYLNKFEEAIKCYDEVLKINPDNVDARYYKTLTLKAISQKNK